MRIVHLTNAYSGRSGGIRTTAHALGAGYRERGLEFVLVVPGARGEVSEHPWGRLVQLPGPPVPGSGGYRALLDLPHVQRTLDELEPDRVELSDRFTLRSVGTWARRAGVPSVMIAHERLDGLLRVTGGVGEPLARRLADHHNRATAAAVDTVVATTRFAAVEFTRIGVPTEHVPLGVDLDTFSPAPRTSAPGRPRLVLCSRLSPEKRPDLAVEALRLLRDRGLLAHLVIAGDGPAGAGVRRAAAGLPVTFVGHLPGRDAVARLLASADVVLASSPGRGVPVVANGRPDASRPCVPDDRSTEMISATTTTAMGPSYGDEAAVLAIAHRGGGGIGPENTVEAFERSLALGFRYLETDVRVTSDGVCVAFHDRDLRRLTGEPGRVEDLTWTQVEKLRVFGRAAVPRLDTLLERWPQARWILDIKQPEAIGALTDVVLSARAEHRVCLSGTWDGPLGDAHRDLGPTARSALGWTSLGRLLAGGGLPRGAADFVHLPLRFGGRHLPTRRLVMHAKAQGLRVVVWGVDTAAAAHRLLDDGVDGLITDRPDLLREVLTARGAWTTGGQDSQPTQRGPDARRAAPARPDDRPALSSSDRRRG